MSQFKPYPAYKDSGVEWLGEVPEHWTVTLLKRGYEVTLGKMLQPESKRDEDELLPYLRAANIQPSGIDITDVKKMWFSASEKNSLSLVKGDLLVSEGGDVGRSAIWELDRQYYFQNSINRIRSIDGNDTLFLYFWMVDIKSKGYIDVLCNKSTIAHFTAEKVAAVPLLIPLKSEQSKIANFLDHETARIDALIEEQKHLIELLKEKRQAVISHAVTKGLDPTVPMKDSGVEWLGEVPVHWEILTTKRLFRLVVDPAPNDNNFELLSVYTEIGVRPRKELAQKGNKASTTDGYWKVKKGDLIVNKLLAWMGAVGYSNYNGVTSPAYDILRPTRQLSSKFYHYIFRGKSAQQEFKRWSRGIMEMRLRLYFDELGRIPMPFPPSCEQGKIVKFIEEMETKFDALSSEASEQVRLLSERRSALISAAVTGKIDVRSWQPPTDNHAPSTAAQKTCLETV